MRSAILVSFLAVFVATTMVLATDGLKLTAREKTTAPVQRPVGTWALNDTGQRACYDATREIACPAPGKPFYGQDPVWHQSDALP
jgi:hypothetical protein